MERIFPDTNVLYPISLADLTLRLGDIAIHAVLWSEDLLAEVERVLVTYKGLSSAQAQYFCDCIRETFPEGEIERATYEDLIESRTGTDADDHVHSAAAVGGGATILITANIRDYPQSDLGPVRKLTPDAYFTEALQAFPDQVLAVLDDMGGQRRDPQPIDTTIDALRRAGLRDFAAQATELLAKNDSA